MPYSAFPLTRAFRILLFLMIWQNIEGKNYFKGANFMISKNFSQVHIFSLSLSELNV